MKRILCRHKDEDMFENLGFGVIKNDLDEKFALIEWLLSKREHFMMKSYLYILDENEISGHRS
tara:strand:+ start:122 stop:310 length:189 start_codon:yes stop_codon:yes gene_type:complete